MLFDAHTHVHFPVYDKDREEVIRRAREAGVKMICVGTQAASSEAAVALAKKYPGEIWATAGFHPNHFASAWYYDKKEQQEAEREEFDAKRLRKIAKSPEVVAIGEFGLDYYRLTDEKKEKENQQEAFEVQVEIAKDLKKSLMMHCRPSYVKTSEGKALSTDDAYLDALNLLSTYGSLPEKIFHFYVGSLEVTKKLVDFGAYFTFGGVITFARDYDGQLKYLPLDRILLETDAPYVAPEPHRGQRNEPSYILETAKKIAEIKGVSYEKVVQETAKNSLTVFKISV